MRLAKPTIKRLTIYKQFLLDMQNAGMRSIYSHQIAEKLGLTAAVVRKDLSQIEAPGAINEGYAVDELINRITTILGTGKHQKVVIFGAGNIGRALLGHMDGFLSKGFIIAKAFDSDPHKQHKTIAGIECLPLKAAPDYIKKNRIKMAILAVPKETVDALANDLVQYGIRCFLNFTPKRLTLPPDVFCESVDFSRELEKLSYHINN